MFCCEASEMCALPKAYADSPLRLSIAISITANTVWYWMAEMAYSIFHVCDNVMWFPGGVRALMKSPYVPAPSYRIGWFHRFSSLHIHPVIINLSVFLSHLSMILSVIRFHSDFIVWYACAFIYVACLHSVVTFGRCPWKGEVRIG